MKAQSEVLGVVLLLGITLTAIGMILFFGAGSLDAIEDQSQQESMTNQFALMDSQMATSVLSDSTADAGAAGAVVVSNDDDDLIDESQIDAPETGEEQSVTMRMEGGRIDSNPDASWMEITAETEEGDTVVLNSTLGNIEHQQGDTVTAYEGGGVWQKDEGADAAHMVSPPEFHYKGDADQQTLTVPVFNVTSERTVSGEQDSFNVRSDGVEVKHGDGGNDPGNPLPPGDVNITVSSDYYQAWGGYFDGRTNAEVVDVDHDNQRVTMVLPIPERDVGEGISEAIYSSGDLELEDGPLIDSYDGGQHNPVNDAPDEAPDGCDYDSTEATVVGTHALEADDDVCIFGDVYGSAGGKGGDLEVDDDAYVHGDLHHPHQGGDIEIDDGAYVGGSVFSSSGIEVQGGVGGEIHSTGPGNSGNVEIDDSPAPVGGNIYATGDVELEDATLSDGVEEIHAADSLTIDDDVTFEGDGVEIHVGGSGGGAMNCDSDADLDGVTIYYDHHAAWDQQCGKAGATDSEQNANVEEPEEPEDVEQPDLPAVDPEYETLFGSEDIDCLNDDGEIVMEGGTCNIDADDENEFNIREVEMEEQSEIRVQGDLNISVTGEMEIEEESEIIVEDGASLTLNSGGEIEVEEESSIKTEPDPHDSERIWIESWDGEMEIQENSQVTGVINSESDDLELEEGAEVYGAIVAGEGNEGDDIDIGGSVHYDKRLDDGGVGERVFNPDIDEVYFLHVTENEILLE